MLTLLGLKIKDLNGQDYKLLLSRLHQHFCSGWVTNKVSGVPGAGRGEAVHLETVTQVRDAFISDSHLCISRMAGFTTKGNTGEVEQFSWFLVRW